MQCARRRGDPASKAGPHGSNHTAARQCKGSEDERVRQEADGGTAQGDIGNRYIWLARTIYIRCTYGIFGLEITKYTVYIYTYIRFWPTLEIRLSL